MKSNTKTALRLLSGVGLAAMCATGVAAQGDEIIVTAAKREQTLQEVPIAVSVVQSDVIEKAQILDIIDLQTVVPSLRVTQLQNSSQTNFVIRGFGNGANNPGIESSVGVFIDGVFRSRSASAILDLPTLERVEVLRGPQSTLFGKNVSAGAISITTAKPQFEWGGSSEVTLGNYDQVLYRGTLTGPITDTLAFRVSGSLNNRDGYYENIATGGDLNERNRWSARGQLLWEASDTLSFRAIGEYNKINEVCCGAVQLFNGPATSTVIGDGGFASVFNPALLGGAPPESLQVINGVNVPAYSEAQIAAGTIQLPVANLGEAVGDPTDPFARQVALNTQPSNELVGRGGSLQGDWDVGFGQVTGIVAYREQSDNTQTDADFSAADLITNPQSRDYETFTAELRMASVGDGPFSWLVGGFYFDEKVKFQRDVLFGTQTRAYADGVATLIGAPGGLATVEGLIGAPVGTTFFQNGQGVRGEYEMDNTSFSIFGQFDYELTDRLTITGGVAYTRDEKDAVGISNLNDPLAALDLEQLGFVGALQALTSNPTLSAADITPALLATPFSAAAIAPGQFDPNAPEPTTLGAAATVISQTDCVNELPTIQCNTALALQPVQFFPADQTDFPDPNNPLDNGQLDDDQVTYTARVAYDFTDSLNAYFTYATGWKAGAFNLSSDSQPPAAGGFGRTAAPEDVQLFEIGAKTVFDGGYLNIALFDQTIEGFQSNLFVGTAFALANAGEQSVRGFEVDAAYSPIDPLFLTFALTYLDPEYDSFTEAPCADFIPECADGQTSFDASGTRPAGIHPVSLSTSATYTKELSPNVQGFLRADYLFESATQVIDNVPRSIAEREVSVVNASAGIEMDNGIGVSLWVRNLTDDEFLLSGFPTVAQDGGVAADPVTGFGSFSGYTNQPRTWGITLRGRI
ncbi:MAG: TonB-dependent receptor [Pseudomonadota bacterium]